MMIKKTDLTIIILAGGKSERMDGKDKGLMMINNQYIIKNLYALAKDYSDNVYINANRNINDYMKMGLEVWQDIIPGYQGPLAGMYTSLKNSKTRYILTLPCDGPLISDIYFKRMLSGNNQNKIRLRSAHNGERLQPVYSLISIDLIKSLEDFLDSGQRKIDKWFETCDLEIIDFSDNKNIFININRESDLLEYKELINKMFKYHE
mgnify:CR=1 FL=1